MNYITKICQMIGDFRFVYEEIKSRIFEIKNYKSLYNWSKRCFELADGLGTNRVVEKILDIAKSIN